MKSIILSSLVKVFKDFAPNFLPYTSGSALSNEPFSFQIAVLPESKSEEKVSVSVTSVLKDDITVYEVKNIPSVLSGYPERDKFYYDVDRKEFPDLLMPIENTAVLKKGCWTSFWFEFKPTKEYSGTKKITVTITAGEETVKEVFTLDIIGVALPEQKLLYTNWFHNDCLCTWYNIEPFSEEYWEVAENYIKNAASHGMNMIITPVFTPPLDTAVGGERPTIQLVKVKKDENGYSFDFNNFERYISICLKSGIKAFEISHLFTQWGAKAAPKIIAEVNGKSKQIFGWNTKSTGKPYTEFLTAFAAAFIKEVKKLGIKDKCWLHVSDEPSKEQLPDYKKASALLHKLFPGFKSFDALSEIEFYKDGLIKNPVCGEQEADVFRKEVKNFWTYYCCGQCNNTLPNRFFAMPSERNRVLGILLYKYNTVGFLQWGHNFWYSQYSVHPINPFEVSDAGGAFPSGDAYVVYPGENGEPLNSLRHLVFYAGFCDMRALTLLESLTSRDFVLSLIERGLDTPLSFTNYPHEISWLTTLRETVNEEIKKHI